MKKAIKLAAFFLFFPVLCFLSSDQVSREASPCTLVMQVDITCRYPQATIRRTYTQPKKMASILNYLRLLQYRGKPETDPETLSADTYSITLHYSDGSRRVYRQCAYRYLSKNYRPWEKIDASHAQLIYPLLQLLPDDG